MIAGFFINLQIICYLNDNCKNLNIISMDIYHKQTKGLNLQIK